MNTGHTRTDRRSAATAVTALDALPRTEDAARDMLERARWPNGACCPHCGAAAPYRLTPRPSSTTRKDVWKCRACRRQFTVSVGTILEASRLKRTVWLKAIYLLCSSGHAVPIHQLHEILGIHYASATSMTRRLRYALEQTRRTPWERAGLSSDGPYVGTWPGAREQAVRFALACRPTLDFGETLERILEVRPQRALRRGAPTGVEVARAAPASPVDPHG
jgi:transposase-like protein